VEGIFVLVMPYSALFLFCRVSNVIKVEDILQSVAVPDVTASSMLAKEIVFPDGSTSATLSRTENAEDDGHSATMAFDPNTFPRFSMCLGDFVDIYGAPDNENFWDAITTCFFVDTAPVVRLGYYLQVEMN
jgi:hypothetical protein